MGGVRAVAAARFGGKEIFQTSRLQTQVSLNVLNLAHPQAMLTSQSRQ
jgi:hypothetical protein